MKTKRMLALAVVALSLALCGCSMLAPIVRNALNAVRATPAATATPRPTATPEPTAEPTAAPEADQVTVGRFDGKVYTNAYFGLTLEFPKGYTITTREQMAKAFQVGLDAIGNTDESLADIAKKAQKKAVYCFLVYNQGGGSISMICTNLSASGLAITDAKLFLSMAKVGMQAQTASYTCGDITEETIGGRDFAVMSGEIDLYGVKGMQRIYCTMLKGYAVLISAGASSQFDLDALDAVIRTAEFR